MNMTEQPEPGRDPDTLLADFADRLLTGQAANLAPDSDKDLRSLEESVVRIHQAFPADVPDEKSRRRLQSDFRERLRGAQGAARQPRWWPGTNRQRLLVACAAVLMLVVLIASPVFLAGPARGLEGTATSSTQNIALLIVFTGVFIFLIWQGRRK